MPRDIDTTTFTPPEPETIDDLPEQDPLRSLPGLPKPKVSRVWECRVCHYSPVDEKTGICYNCGRNWAGEFVGVPDAEDKPARAQIRSDGR